MANNEDDNLDIHNLFEVSVIVTQKNSKPAIELRSLTTNMELIKLIISAAYHNRPIIIMPKFTNKMESLNSCIQKGILYREGNEYFFTI